MSLFAGLGDIERNVRNKRLLDDISKLSQDIKASITELSDKAQKLNELTDQYKESQSESKTNSNSGEKVESKPSGITGFISSLFSSKPEPPSDASSPPPEPVPEAAVDNIDDTNSPSAASEESTAPLASSEQPIGASEDIYIPDESTGSSSDTPPPPAIEPMGASEGIYNPGVSTGDIQLPSSDISPLETLQAPVSPDGLEDSSTVRGGKNMKKSKRSKKTIRKTDKKSNRVTKKQKVNNADDKERAKGLIQARLQSQGQSIV